MSSRDGHMALFTSSKKDLGVVTPLVTAKKRTIYFAERVPSLRMRHSFSWQGLQRVSAFLYLFLI